MHGGLRRDVTCMINGSRFSSRRTVIQFKPYSLSPEKRGQFSYRSRQVRRFVFIVDSSILGHSRQQRCPEPKPIQEANLFVRALALCCSP